ncbi:MAG: hypothetical protein JSS81_13325 [Acidobacteria bacterium]|nr:hypothetical protein [Acidobacteriota bacterium]
MSNFYRKMLFFGLFWVLVAGFSATAGAQTKNGFELLTGAALTKVVPTSFYFAGQSAATQARNTAAATLGKDRYILAGMVDTSGYSTEISGKYEGFFITDSPVDFGGKTLATGAYGFGFAADGSVKIFDLSSKEIFSVATTADAAMKRPRPLQMTLDAKGVRFYKGKNYVLIAPK